MSAYHKKQGIQQTYLLLFKYSGKHIDLAQIMSDVCTPRYHYNNFLFHYKVYEYNYLYCQFISKNVKVLPGFL